MRNLWRAGFLGLTVLVLAAELWASLDGDPNTDPWTDLITTYIPWEITAALLGALFLWLPLHFGVRYWRRTRGAPSQTGEESPHGNVQF